MSECHVTYTINELSNNRYNFRQGTTDEQQPYVKYDNDVIPRDGVKYDNDVTARDVKLKDDSTFCTVDDDFLTSSSSSPLSFHRSEPLFRSDRSFLDTCTWRNPRQPNPSEISDDMLPSVTISASDDVMSRRSDDVTRSDNNQSGSGSSTSVSEEFHMYPVKGVAQITSHDNDNDVISANKGVFGVDWLDHDKLAQDLNSIIPNFEFSTSPNLNMLTRTSYFSSEGESECETDHEGAEERDRAETYSYTSSCDWEPRPNRHSWAGQLDIIDCDSDGPAIEYHSKRSIRRKRDSFDRSFSIKKRPVVEKRNNLRAQESVDVVQFESQSCLFDHMGFKYFLRQKSISTSLILERQYLTIKFISQKEYLCSSVKKQKRKLVIHLLDVKNAVVLADSNTLIIQFKENSRCKQSKSRQTIDKMSDTLRSSRSTSLNHSVISACEAEISEVEVGKFNNCQHLASLILRRREALLPKGILKRGSKRKTLEPVIIAPVERHVQEEEEFMEFLSYV